jgi:hypothetical protein
MRQQQRRAQRTDSPGRRLLAPPPVPVPLPSFHCLPGRERRFFFFPHRVICRLERRWDRCWNYSSTDASSDPPAAGWGAGGGGGGGIGPWPPLTQVQPYTQSILVPPASPVPEFSKPFTMFTSVPPTVPPAGLQLLDGIAVAVMLQPASTETEMLPAVGLRSTSQ